MSDPLSHLSAAASAAAITSLALSLAASPAFAAPGRGHPASPQAAAGALAPLTSLRLDFKQLSAMRAGQKVVIDFPAVGKKAVIFEALTTGLDGTRYWHGRLDGNPNDRVYLKQAGKGVVGALRLGARHIPLRQGEGERLLAAAEEPAPVSGHAYALTATHEPGVYALEGHFAELTQAQAGSEIHLPLPDGQAEVAVLTRAAPDEHGFMQVQGVSRMEGVGAPVVLTIGTHGVFGTIMARGSEYQIVTRQGKVQLIDPRGAGWTHLRGPDQVSAQGEAHGETHGSAPVGDPEHAAPMAAAGTATGAAAALPLPLAAGKVDTTINLLISYSQSYVSLWGGEAAARTRLSSLVETANAAYANSGTGIALRVVGWSLVSQADATPQTVLPTLRAGTGAFSGLPALKRSAGAAITVFVAPFNATTSATGTCGVAYIPGSNAAGLAAFKSQVASVAYAAINDGQYGQSYCETLTLAHELGHTLGNVHDEANSSFPGVFSYSYGKGVPGSFGTVMSYVSPRVGLFSSPELRCGAAQQPCGSGTENVVATMLQTKSAMAALGGTAPGTPSTPAAAKTQVTGWLVHLNGKPLTAASTVKAQESGVTCQSGITGLYVCQVPTAVTTVNLSAATAGKVALPPVGTFNVSHGATAPTTGTKFYFIDEKFFKE